MIKNNEDASYYYRKQSRELALDLATEKNCLLIKIQIAEDKLAQYLLQQKQHMDRIKKLRNNYFIKKQKWLYNLIDYISYTGKHHELIKRQKHNIQVLRSNLLKGYYYED